MKACWIIAASAAWTLLLPPAPASAQPILKRVEQLLRDQLGNSSAPASAEPGYLGMLADETPGATGVQLLEVYPGQPAAQAGLAVGDIITGVNGRPVRTMDDLMAAVGNQAMGTKLTLSVLRDGQSRDRVVTLARRPAAESHELPSPEEPGTPIAGPPDARPPADQPVLSGLPGGTGPRLGVRSVVVTPDVQRQHNLPDTSGAHVISVATGSAAEQAKIPLGAVITGVNDTQIRSPQELAAVIRSLTQGDIELTYVHAGRTQRVPVKLEMPESPVAPAPLVETQARKAQAAQPPPDGPDLTSSAEPAAVDPAEARLQALEARVQQLEGQIKTLEAKLASPPAN